MTAATGPDLSLTEDFMSAAEADALLRRLHASLAWRRDSIRLFGREHFIPRLHQWYGDPGAAYRWSGLAMRPLDWTPELAQIRECLEEALGCRFNSVLANLYRDGDDCMGWHSDDEPELGDRPVIASLSLGAARDFRLREKGGPGRETLALGSGSLLVMRGATQRDWQHALPKRKRVSQPRVNLTFRYVLQSPNR